MGANWFVFRVGARGQRTLGAQFRCRFQAEERESLERVASLADVAAGYDDDIPTARDGRRPPKLVNTSLRVGDTDRPES